MEPPGTISRKLVLGLRRKQRPQCWAAFKAAFHGRRPHDGVVIMMAVVVVVLAIMNNLRFPEGGHPWLVAHHQASIIFISLQGTDHDHATVVPVKEYIGNPRFWHQ
jgi:hypothetical protein